MIEGFDPAPLKRRTLGPGGVIMGDHTKAIVPLETWCYSSPELRSAGISVDIGLFAEALIYYESVALQITSQPQLAEFIRWFKDRDQLDDLLALIRDGTVQFYDYSFGTAAIFNPRTGGYSLTNLQDPVQAEPDTFERRFLYHPSIEAILPKGRQRNRLYQAFRGRVHEVKASDFGNANDNARKDYTDPRRNALVVQCFVDELYRFRRQGRPPEVEASVDYCLDGTQHRITYNIDFGILSRLAGPNLNFSNGTPLTAGAYCNRLIWSAAQLRCDLYVGKPMGMLVGDKFYEATERVAKAEEVVEGLKAEVEFPDVRTLVNSGKLDLRQVLSIRAKAGKFRTWLKQESNRDRNAIIAYHNETARELGIVKAGRMSLSLFGVIGGGAVGGLIGSIVAGPPGGALGGATGSAIGFLADVASKVGSGWRPVVFGDWMRHRIQKIVSHDHE